MRKGRGEITKLSALFEKYKTTLKAPQGSVISCFQEVISELIGIEIKKESISYTVSTKVLAVRVSGPLRSELMLHKREILAHMKGRLGEQNAPQEIV